APAHLAFAAADPRKHQAALADIDLLGVGTERRHLADGFVPHGQRQGHAAVGQLKLLAAAEIVDAFPEMQVAVADAGRDHPPQDLGTDRLRRRLLAPLQRGTALADVEALHSGRLTWPAS